MRARTCSTRSWPTAPRSWRSGRERPSAGSATGTWRWRRCSPRCARSATAAGSSSSRTRSPSPTSRSSRRPPSRRITASICAPAACRRMVAERVRIAVIGAGRMGQVHLEALRQSRSARPVAVVDPVPAVRDAVAAGGLAAYATVEQLLVAGGFDGALIAAPTDLHASLVTTLAAARVPILCEKPCGTTSEEAVVAARAVEAAGTLLQIGYWRRFVPELAALRERVARGELGEITLVASHQWDEHPPGAEFRAHSGGIAADMGVHEFDQVRWLLGQEFEKVAAMPAGAAGADAAPADP